MPGKRTGIMPSKKNFTAVGGVGARHIAMQNKISRQAPRVASTMVAAAPAPAPAPAALNNLFDIDSFHPRNQYTPLDPPYMLALIAATERWNKLLSFHPDGLNIIKTNYKETFNKEWNGFKLLSVSYRTNPNQIVTTEPVTISGTKIPYGFRLRINKGGLTNGMMVEGILETFTQENIEHVFAHELGHALGLCATISREDVVRLPSIPTLPGFPIYFNPTSNTISAQLFPQTHSEHAKLIRSATERFVAGPSFVMLSSDEWHWEKNMVSHEVYSYDPQNQRYNMITKQIFGNFENEIITVGFNPHYDNTVGYLISNKSLKYLTEIRPFDLQMYVEKNRGASEVSSVIKFGVSPNVTYILKGKAGVIVPATRGILSVERSVHRDDATEPIYSVIYPEGYAGECNDDEIIRLVKSHERIVNDPKFVEFKCCH